MQLKPLKRMGGAIATAIVALALIGCRGATGQNGLNGTNGTNGTNGSNGSPGATYTIDATKMTPGEWGQLEFKGSITGATMGTSSTVSFKVTDQKGTPIKGLGFTTQNSTAKYPSFPSLGFTVAKLVPGTNGSPSRWVDYIVLTAPKTADTAAIPRLASYENYGTLLDNGDGSYRYTFRWDLTQIQSIVNALSYTAPKSKDDLGNVSYQPTLTHRMGIFIGGNAPGTGTVTPTGANTGIPAVHVKTAINLVYDFIPATGAVIGATDERRDMVSMDACNQCHTKLAFHGANRVDPRFCVICHTDQLKYGYAEATTTSTGYSGDTNKIQGFAAGDFSAMIHRFHMGEELKKDGYKIFGILANEITYPQDHRNCVKCHSASSATPQGDNWFNKPSRMACGACHDQVNWETGDHHGVNDEGGPQLNDQNCVNCHDAAAIKTVHLPVVPPNPLNVWNVAGGNNNTNASYIAAFTNNLPPGASKITWDLKSLTFNGTKPVVTFRFLKDGAPVVFNTYPAKTEMMDNFVGGPSVYVTFTVPYDGIAYPADWNASISTYLKNIWRGDGKDMSGANLAAGAKGTLAGPDGTGYYALTFTDAIIPPTAGMVIAGIGYTYGLTNTQPLTQTNVPGYPYIPRIPATLGTGQGGLSVPAPNATKMVSGTLPAGFDTTQATTARRAIVSNQKCNDCHGALGVFTAKSYHAGQRNDAPTCEFCHNGQRVNSGWGVNTKDFVHALHGAGKRVNKFSWEASAGFKYWTITYPAILNNCEACHVPGSYDFAISANAGEVPNLNWTTVATGTIPNPVPVVLTGNEPIPGTYYSPFVTAGAVYGSGFSFSGNTGVSTPAAITTLVSSPYVAACSNCHDSTMALNHMKANGGSFYVPRSSVQNPPIAGGKLINNEQCFLCHSSGKIADVKEVHMNFK